MKYIVLLVVAAVIAGGAYALVGRDPTSEQSPSPSPSVSVSMSPTPKTTPKKTPTPTPSRTPGIQVQEATVHNATIQGFAFIPATITVKKGDIISFKNMDSVAHTVTSLDGAFDSGLISSGEVATLMTANLVPGTYAYMCIPHPSMRGTIIVQ